MQQFIPCIKAICPACIGRFCSCCWCCCDGCGCWVAWLAALWWVGESIGRNCEIPVSEGNSESSKLPLSASLSAVSGDVPAIRWVGLVVLLVLAVTFAGSIGCFIPRNWVALTWTQNPIFKAIKLFYNRLLKLPLSQMQNMLNRKKSDCAHKGVSKL